MMNKIKPLIVMFLFLMAGIGGAQELPSEVEFREGPVNAVEISRNGSVLAVNQAISPDAEILLLTDGRRDIVEAARSQSAEKVIASEHSKAILEGSQDRWAAWETERFNYYGQEVTQWAVRDFPASQYLSFDGEGEAKFEWQGVSVECIATPGYTVDGVSYLIELDGVKLAFVGDLILAGGKVRDLYSFQNAIPAAKVGAYHGYLGRLGAWLDSLAKVEDWEPDFMISSRGPISTEPLQDIQKARDAAKAIYRNYLSANALHWYFGEERMGACAEQVLGADHGVEGMPFAEHVDLPEWCHHIGTTNLLVSESGEGFVLDVGGQRSFEAIWQLVKDGLVTKVDGIFATHLHNDHTAAISDASDWFECPVYALPEVAGALQNPGAWFLPGLSMNAVPEVTTVADGETLKWKEFTFTFRFYPGQMYNHGAVLVEKEGSDPVFFIGDSFSPSGIDDYCLMNRNLMRDDTGYALCFRIIESLPQETWLVNQHIPHLFRFSNEEREFLKSQYAKRAELISDFVYWDDLNYAIDAQWASFFPYGQKVKKGERTKTSVRIWNHSTEEHAFEVFLNCPDISAIAPKSLLIPARQEGVLEFEVSIPKLGSEFYVVTASVVRDDGVTVSEFCETMLQVSDD